MKVRLIKNANNEYWIEEFKMSNDHTFQWTKIENYSSYEKAKFGLDELINLEKNHKAYIQNLIIIQVLEEVLI